MFKSQNFLIIMIAFIVLQPIIDVLTTASILWTNSSLSVGILLRTLYFLTMAVFILVLALKVKQARWYLAYLIGLAAMLVINIVVNMQVKSPYYLVQELTFFNKAIYFHVMLFGFLLIFKLMKENGKDVKTQIIRMLLTSSIIISAVFIISQLTQTSMSNYARSKEGWTGWFYAGNEIGAIMSILLPLTALYAVQKTNGWKDIKYWVPFIALSISMLALGTKVGYGGILVVLLSSLMGSLILWFMKKERTFKMNAMVSGLLLAVFLAVTPFTPVFNNMYAHLGILGIEISNNDPDELPPQNGDQEIAPEDEEPLITGEQFQNLVFSSREQYAKDYKYQFADAPMVQKLFGMGFAGNYEEDKPKKMIEMDFHDFFYAFGLLGFLYIMSPLIWFTGVILLSVIKDLSREFSYFTIFTGVSLLLGFGIAYSAGHTLTAPGVSIYLATVMALFVFQIHYKKTKTV